MTEDILLNRYDYREVLTSEKLNETVDAVNGNVLESKGRFFFSEATVEEVIGGTVTKERVTEIHRALFSKAVFIKSIGSYVLLVPHTEAGSHAKFAFIFGGAVYECVITPSDDMTVVKRGIASKEDVERLSVTFSKEEWDAMSDEEREAVKANYDTVYITGDVSDWVEKPSVATSFPADNVPKDNVIYNLGERGELTIAGTPENGCASISVVASADGMTLGIGEGVKVIGDVPEIEAGKEYFIGIVDGKVYVNEVSTQEGA